MEFVILIIIVAGFYMFSLCESKNIESTRDKYLKGEVIRKNESYLKDDENAQQAFLEELYIVLPREIEKELKERYGDDYKGKERFSTIHYDISRFYAELACWRLGDKEKYDHKMESCNWENRDYLSDYVRSECWTYLALKLGYVSENIQSCLKQDFSLRIESVIPEKLLPMNEVDELKTVEMKLTQKERDDYTFYTPEFTRLDLINKVIPFALAKLNENIYIENKMERMRDGAFNKRYSKEEQDRYYSALKPYKKMIDDGFDMINELMSYEAGYNIRHIFKETYATAQELYYRDPSKTSCFFEIAGATSMSYEFLDNRRLYKKSGFRAEEGEFSNQIEIGFSYGKFESRIFNRDNPPEPELLRRFLPYDERFTQETLACSCLMSRGRVDLERKQDKKKLLKRKEEKENMALQNRINQRLGMTDEELSVMHEIIAYECWYNIRPIIYASAISIYASESRRYWIYKMVEEAYHLIRMKLCRNFEEKYRLYTEYERPEEIDILPKIYDRSNPPSTELLKKYLPYDDKFTRLIVACMTAIKDYPIPNSI